MAAGPGCKRARIDRADPVVGAISDISDAVPDRDRSRPDPPLPAAELHFGGREIGDLPDLAGPRIDDIDRARVASGSPDETGRRVVTYVVHVNAAATGGWQRQ